MTSSVPIHRQRPLLTVLLVLLTLAVSFQMFRVFSPKVLSVVSGKRFLSKATISKESEEIIKSQALALVGQKLSILDVLIDDDYTRKNPVIYNACVGSHLRHILDHYHAVLVAHDEIPGLANYDDRKRQTSIETSTEAARHAVQALQNQIPKLDLHKEITIQLIGNDTTFETYQAPSTVGRELAFASHHAIHHLSTIKLIMTSMGYSFPGDSKIGIAPSTVKDMKQNYERYLL